MDKVVKSFRDDPVPLRDFRYHKPGRSHRKAQPVLHERVFLTVRRALRRVLKAVADFKPMFPLIALGLDTAKGDPTGTWSLAAEDFEANGRLLGELALPTLVVQEGGYRTRTLGVNTRRFFKGLATEINRI